MSLYTEQCFHYDCDLRNNAGYCKVTSCINPKYSNIGTAQYGQGVQKRIITNGDRIRTMTDEELAEYLEYYSDRYFRYDKSWLEWLKQEADNAR